ncbi:MAG: hypothetical protein WCG75_03395, partial [Armatimonadota bacterium]
MQNKKIRVALSGLFVVATAMAAAQGRVNGISVSKQANGVDVLIQGSGLKSPKANFETSDKVYTLEFDAPFSGKQEKIQVWMNGLQTVQTSKPDSKSPKTKFVFTFTKGVNASIVKVDNGFKVSFEASDMKLASKTASQNPVQTEKAEVGTHFGLAHNMFLTAFQTIPTSMMLEFQNQPKVENKPLVNSKSALKNLPSVITASLPRATVDPKVAAQVFSNVAPTKTSETKAISTKTTVKKPTEIKATTPKPTDKKPTDKKPTVAVNKPAPEVKNAVAEAVASTGSVKVRESLVSLDFVNTDVVQILKSLARQTNANIVTSPDVTGKLSIKVENVSIRESLNLVTSLAGLRFAQIGRTFVVTSPAKFLETMRSVQGAQEEMTLSRVVPIFSGQGNQIKVAVLKSVSSENAFGRFELVLPSEKSTVSASQKVGAQDKKEDDKNGTNIATQTTEASSDAYVMLIGSPGRLDEVEQLVQGIDRQLCLALGVKVPSTNSQVLATYFVHGGSASDLVDALAGKGKSTIGNVELRSTPTGSISRQAIIVKGRDDEVQNVVKALGQLDGEESAETREIQVVELQYSDPRAVREFVVAQVPGITCVIAPNGVMNSQTYVPDAMRTQSEQRGTNQPAPQGGGTQGGNGSQGQQSQGSQQAGQTGETKVSKDMADSGITLPFESFEKTAFPMRLILKGSKAQVQNALDLIRTTDVAPKQVALEMRVMELSREEMLKLGIDWKLFTSGAIKTISLNNGQTSPSNTIGATIQGKDISGDVGASLDSISNGTNLISRPNILCNDGRESEVFVGDAIRYVESIISSQNGPSVTTGVVRAGVRLVCFPRIGKDDTLNLDIRTAITYLKGFKTVPQIGGELPQTSERTAQNTITMKGGETFAIGGLMQQQDVVELSGLPILKDLPIVGRFFR